MIRLRNIYLALALLCITGALSAQNHKVLLKNGSLLRGHIEDFQDDLLLIRIDSASIISVNTASIRKIDFRFRRHGLSDNIVHRIKTLNDQESKVAFYHQLRFGILNGEDANFFRRLSTVSMDYTFFRKSKGSLYTGVGIGLDFYTSFIAVPVFFEFRHDFSNKPSNLFFYTRLGYSRAKTREEFTGNFGNVKGKEVWALGLGHEWPLGKTHLLISAGFHQQSLRSVLEFQDFKSETDWQLKRLDFKVGIKF